MPASNLDSMRAPVGHRAQSEPYGHTLSKSKSRSLESDLEDKVSEIPKAMKGTVLDFVTF